MMHDWRDGCADFTLRGGARTLDKNMHKITHKNKTKQGEEGRKTFNMKRFSFFLSSYEPKEKKSSYKWVNATLLACEVI
jgi:hypothetical protein